MGREIKRVPLDFAHPLNEVWPGFVNPHYAKCADCDGSSYTPDRLWLESITHLLLIAGGDGITGRLHPWVANMVGSLGGDAALIATLTLCAVLAACL